MKRFVHLAGRRYIERICRAERLNQRFLVHNERTIEYQFALSNLGRKRPVSVLDVGTGTTAWPHLLRTCGYCVTAIDNIRDYWPQGMVNRHWDVLDVDILKIGEFGKQRFDAITCISVIEHIKDHRLAIENMKELLNPGGLLILTTPFSYNNPYPNVYSHPEALYGSDLPYICRSSSRVELTEWLGAGFKLEKQELWRLFSGPVWATGERVPWHPVEDANDAHQLGCFLFSRS